MSEFDWLRSTWRALDPDFRRQAAANAVGTFVGGFAVVVLLGLAAVSARHVKTWVLVFAAVVAALAWVVAIGSDPKNEGSAGVTLGGLYVSAAVFAISTLAVVARIGLAAP